MSNTNETTLYERVGGMEFFISLVDHFYAGVVGDEALWSLYPDQSDLVGAKHRLALFLGQYWGGPDTYNQERGHPKLRLRHMPFHVGPLERDRWLLHMAAAIEQTIPEVDETYREHVTTELTNYMVNAAEAMRNV